MITYKDCWYKKVCKKYTRNQINCITCPKFIEMKAMFELSNLPEKKWNPQTLLPLRDEDSWNKLTDIKRNIKDWVDNGKNLYIYSSICGNGKTSWAVKLLQSYFDKVWVGNCLECRGLFISVPNFLIKNKEIITKFDNSFVDLKSKIDKVDLVIWDDIASTKLTDYEHELLLAYIDTRILNEKSNIFTGNANEEVMKTYLGERLTSRVWASSKVIEFTNLDMRGVEV